MHKKELPSDLIKKTYSFDIKNINSQDPDYFYFKGYASTFDNVDLGDDVMLKGCFTDTLRQNQGKPFPILWQHEMEEPLGIIEEIFEDNNGLFVSAKLPIKDDFVRNRVIPQIKIGSVREMSIGFRIKDSETRGSNIRYIKQVELYEVSLVTKAMNPKAIVESFKSVNPAKGLDIAARDTNWDSSAAIRRIKEFSSSQDSPSSNYKKYFLYYDENNSENFGAYKLPFVDVIDGEPLIIPRAVFSIAGILRGARGGVDLPEEDRAKIVDVVNGFYSKMASKFNDPSLVSPLVSGKSIAEIQSQKEIEIILKNSGFSNTEAKTLISKIKEFASHRDVESNSEAEVFVAKAIEIERLNNLKNLLNKI